MVKTANLAIVFIDLKGYTAKTMELSRKAHQDHLNTYKSLVLPVAKAFNGKLIKGIGDAFLLTFASPTDSVLFGKNVQDCLWNYNKDLSSSDKIEARVAINVGEVRLDKGDIYGEAVNIAARVESLGEAGEILLTDAVYLAMNKAEVATERVGEYDLKGIPKPVLIHRTKKINNSEKLPPYASETLEYRSMQFPDINIEKAHNLVNIIKDQTLSIFNKIRILDKKMPAAKIIIFAVLIVTLVLDLFILGGNSYPDVEAKLRTDKPKEALTLLKKTKDIDDGNWLFLVGRAYALLKDEKRMLNFYTLALDKDTEEKNIPTIISDTLPLLKKKNSKTPVLLYKKYLINYAQDKLLEATTDKDYYLRWNAIHILKETGAYDDIDFEQVYIADLKHASACSTRKKAAEKLAEIGGEKALEALKDEAQSINFLRNLCMGSTLTDAIEKLEEK